MDAVYQILDVGLILAVPYLAYRIFKGAQHWATRRDPYVCLHCGHEGAPRVVYDGLLVVEVVLWLFLIIPGLVYSLWRQGTRRKICAVCGWKRLVRPDTPAARAKLSDVRSVVHDSRI